MTDTKQTETDHRHAFYLTRTFIGRESGQRFFVGTCSCGATETNVAR